MNTSTAESVDGRQVILVGSSRVWLKALTDYQADSSVIVVDEPEVVRKRDMRAKTADVPTLRELIDWEYQLPGAADAFYHQHRDLRPAAVVPVSEYSVPFAARLAERYGTTGAGYGAAQLLRDKSLLRTAAAAAGIPNPQSVAVSGPDDVRVFMAGVAGPIVLKPANRHASVGTQVVRHPGDVAAAWAACMDQDEGALTPDRPMPLRMLAERFLDGVEFSVEMLVRGGEPMFGAVTRKFLFDGPRPVERGHLHPADVDAELTARLLSSTARVVDAVGMDTGFVHCEWIVEDGVPHLVECAGRLPGDYIMDAVELAWQYGLFGQYWRVMKGEPLSEQPPARAPKCAAVWFAHAPAGEVEAVDGVTEAKGLPGVHLCTASVEPGMRVRELRSSWDRVAFALAEGATPAAALATAQQAVNRVTIKVRDV